MNKKQLLTYCSVILFAFLSHSDAFCYTPVIWNGKVYDDSSVADLITIITTTNPVPTIPSTKHIYPSQVSLCRIPALALCKKIIVFDGIQPGYEHRIKDYNQYKKNIVKLTKNDPYFSNTTLVFCKSWVHLAGAIKEAMSKVTTPFVFIHQHDFFLLKDFDLNALVATMAANPYIKHVRLNRGATNTEFIDWEGPIAEVPDPTLFVPLCRTCGWSDNDHVARVDYYQHFVLPQCGRCAMENVLHLALKRSILKFGVEAGHQPFGTYLYGDLSDGNYFYHSDGRGS